MLHLISQFTFIIVVIGMGCNTSEPIDNNPYFTPYFGHSEITINDVVISMAPYARTSSITDTVFNLFLVQLNENLFPLSQLNFINIPKIVGKHKVVSGEAKDVISSWFSTYIEGDIGGDIFKYYSSLDPSHLDLGSYEQNIKEIACTFKLQLIRSNQYVASPEYHDTLNIVGELITRIDFEE